MKHIHFIGIGGIGMGALALLGLEKGFHVTGSDIHHNPVTAQLADKGAVIALGHHGSHINGADVVVYSTAIGESNPEMQAAKEQGVRLLQRAELLAEWMEGQHSVTVAGAHGKTTTSCMISQMMIQAGLNPTCAIGGVAQGSALHAMVGEGKLFVAEVDESDGSFLNFFPDYSVITNIDFEHLNYYRSWSHILKTYDQFIRQTKPGGEVIINGDDQKLLKLAETYHGMVKTFGFLPINDLYATDLRLEPLSSVFNVVESGRPLGEVRLSIPGRHNIINSLACISVARSLFLDWEGVLRSLADYKGVCRRFHILGRWDETMVVDDYAHHPTEIITVLETAQRAKSRRLITVFQPHRLSRLQPLSDEFAASLVNTDELVLTDVYTSYDEVPDNYSLSDLQQRLHRLMGSRSTYVPREALLDHLKGRVEKGDLIIFLGAGDITHVAKEFARELNRQDIFPRESVS